MTRLDRDPAWWAIEWWSLGVGRSFSGRLPRSSSSTPLFRDVESNQPLRTGALRRLLQSLMLAIGEEPKQFGLHSLRIGGATALFAAGATPIVIRTMGRWSSDCYRLYVRACYEQTLFWSSRCGSTPVRGLAGQWFV